MGNFFEPRLKFHDFWCIELFLEFWGLILDFSTHPGVYMHTHPGVYMHIHTSRCVKPLCKCIVVYYYHP